MERVNCTKRQRRYKARDKERIIQSIIKLHDQGYSQVDIAKQLDIARGTIKRWNDELHFFKPRTPGEAGKLKCKKYDYDENYFEHITTPNQAYIVGYITGDGTIFDRGKSKRLVLSLAEMDQQLLVDIAKELNVEELVTFRKKHKSTEQNKYSLTLNSTKLCNDLIALGIGPRKTGKERWIDFQNDALQWPYLRGFFDADGHIKVSNRGNRIIARFGLTSNEEMLKSIHQFLNRYGFGLKVKTYYKKQGCADLTLGSIQELRGIYKMLYQYGNLKLNRKYEKFSSLMR